MTLGYYWACHREHGWRIVEVVRGLTGAVLWRGRSEAMSEYGDFRGPLKPPVAGIVQYGDRIVTEEQP